MPFHFFVFPAVKFSSVGLAVGKLLNFMDAYFNFIMYRSVRYRNIISTIHFSRDEMLQSFVAAESAKRILPDGVKLQCIYWSSTCVISGRKMGSSGCCWTLGDPCEAVLFSFHKNGYVEVSKF